MEKTATEVLKDRARENELGHALAHLLDSLREWIRVYPFEEGVDLPAHDVVWVDSVTGDGGPGRAILQAIKMYPELWAEAIPPECCIIRREALEALTNKDVAAALALHGEAAVENSAYRVRSEHERAQWEERTRPRVR